MTRAFIPLELGVRLEGGCINISDLELSFEKGQRQSIYIINHNMKRIHIESLGVIINKICNILIIGSSVWRI